MPNHFYCPEGCGGCQQIAADSLLDPYTVTSKNESVTVWLHKHCADRLKVAHDLLVLPAQQYLVLPIRSPIGQR